MSETWLINSNSELVNITGYNFASNRRKSKVGDDVEYKFSGSEVIKIIVSQAKYIIVDCAYRLPNQNSALCLEKFNDILSIIS